MILNYFDIAIIAFMLVFAIVGYFRGLLINVVNFIRLSVGTFLCFYISSKSAVPIYNLYVKERALAEINKNITNSNNIDTVIDNLNDFISNLPSFVSKGMDLKIIDITSKDLSKNILDNLFEPVLINLIKVLVFVAVLIVFFAATGIIIRIVRKNNRRKENERGKESVARKTDKLLGLVLGILKGGIIAFAICAVISFIAPSLENINGAKEVIKQIDSSVCLEFIDRINPFNAITEGIL